MKLPPVQGSCHQSTFFFYAACDSQYFEEFGYQFVNSILKHNQAGVHLHLFNPQDHQLEFLHQRGASVTWETVPLEQFATVSSQQLQPTELERTQTAMKKGRDTSITERFRKTYYACVRFVRLQEVFSGSVPVLAIDMDAVVRKPIPPLSLAHDFYLHHITGRKARYLAGGLWLNPGAVSQQFVTDYAAAIRSYFERDYIYWGIDQDVLDTVLAKYQPGQLPMTYIDWNMQDASYIWTAKGTRKELQTFKTEKSKYDTF